jgi:glutathione synthase/RimK-type ligase-like ATP-grasp enzyme
MEIPKSLAILRTACDENNIAFRLEDAFSGFVARLTKGSKSYLAGAAGIGVYPINRGAPFAIARDKAFTHFILERAGFRAPAGGHFFLNPQGDYVRPPGRERADAMDFAGRLSDGHRQPLIVKPNSGKGAKLVTFVRTRAELVMALEAIAESDDVALIQSFIDEPEFRLFLVDGEIVFAYRKARATIIGDGRRTISALCRSASPLFDVRRSSFLQAALQVRGFSEDAVLPDGEALAIDFISNISASGRFAGFTEPSPPVREWARRLARTVSLRVTGIDVFSRSELADPSDFFVTDVNGAPNLGTLHDLGYRDLVMGVWRDILRKTFDEPWPEEF